LAPYLSEYYNVGWVPVSKPFHVEYQKEYGFDELEIQTDSLNSDDNVLIVDDILSTGSSLYASQELIKKTGANIIGAVILGKNPIQISYNFDFPILILLNPVEYKINAN
jgi:adenine/guanine phosphoribosyltransferase-like PRPP-binding protein